MGEPILELRRVVDTALKGHKYNQHLCHSWHHIQRENDGKALAAAQPLLAIINRRGLFGLFGLIGLACSLLVPLVRPKQLKECCCFLYHTIMEATKTTQRWNRSV